MARPLGRAGTQSADLQPAVVRVVLRARAPPPRVDASLVMFFLSLILTTCSVIEEKVFESSAVLFSTDTFGAAVLKGM